MSHGTVVDVAPAPSALPRGATVLTAESALFHVLKEHNAVTPKYFSFIFVDWKMSRKLFPSDMTSLTTLNSSFDGMRNNFQQESIFLTCHTRYARLVITLSSNMRHGTVVDVAPAPSALPRGITILTAESALFHVLKEHNAVTPKYFSFIFVD